ncbi:hypothetical protein L207DRAFT_590589 [Hyaloscypha variabilis F]|uniref:Uncharacterized protein n=1 Tax=Hyaloscypha variabilis (strain UAMH 11265 / GT02V1 / F) TaxID=1149755 RepID=A0A2J6R1A9_HYAVF|nr:hypothetical protein L207DRAFT_590589 [Hyaloscypha variabilis F]
MTSDSVSHFNSWFLIIIVQPFSCPAYLYHTQHDVVSKAQIIIPIPATARLPIHPSDYAALVFLELPNRCRQSLTCFSCTVRHKSSITMSDASNAKLGSITQDILWGCASDESIQSSDEEAVAPGSPSDTFFNTSEDSDRDGDSAAV